MYDFTYKKLFLDNWHGDNSEVSHLEKACEEFFYANDKRKLGLNKEGELCLKGFRARHYVGGSILWEPIVFNISTKQTRVEEERVKFIDRIAQEDYEMHTDKKSDYRGIKNICFIFFDGENVKEYLFNSSHPYSKDNIIAFANQLEEHFYLRVIREKQQQKVNAAPTKPSF